MGRFRNSRDLSCGCNASMLVELDAQNVCRFGRDERIGILERSARLVGHERNAVRSASDRCHALQVIAIYWLLEVIKAMRLKGSRSEEHTSELQSLMRISYAVFCLKKKKR